MQRASSSNANSAQKLLRQNGWYQWHSVSRSTPMAPASATAHSIPSKMQRLVSDGPSLTHQIWNTSTIAFSKLSASARQVGIWCTRAS